VGGPNSGPARLGVFKKMATGANKGDLRRLMQVRQFSSMVTWLLVKILDRSSLQAYKGRPTKLDGIIQDKIRAAIKSNMETEKLILWVCNAAEVEKQEGKEQNERAVSDG